MSLTNLLTVALLTTAFSAQAADPTAPMAAPDLVFDEVDGIVAVEAEHFYRQTLTEQRAWHITSSKSAPDMNPDADPPHVAGASGGAYLEILPDTRATHGDQLIAGENFSDKPGVMAVLHYKVNINTPGRYYVWVRSFSTGSEDNGVHLGLNGRWPESGQRWQTVQKQKWARDCKQRTADVHTGVPMQLFLDIEKAGEHEILFSMREDGFEMDKFVLASNQEYTPEGTGPAVKAKAGQIPAPFPEVAKAAPLVLPRQPDGQGAVEISGELKEWHKVTLTLDGPYAHELDNAPNPFTDGKGMNVVSCLPYNAGGDGDNVWPFVARDDKCHWDCSKLDQWGMVFDHATAQGLYLHFKLQENEIDDDRRGDKSEPGRVPSRSTAASSATSASCIAGKSSRASVTRWR